MNQHELIVKELQTGYGENTVINELSLMIPSNKISVIIGANGCGKSTLLKSLSRLLKPKRGAILLDDKSVNNYSSRDIARTLGLLPQSPVIPEGITVADLVSRGRYPYQKMFQGMTSEDYKAVEEALELMEISDLADVSVDELSGGQRQRVWIAMSLAQDTDILLLDEPTTFLDIAYQVDILEKLTELNRKKGTTIVMILHDINLSAKYANHLIAMKKGAVVAAGTPAEIVTEDIMKEIYDLDCIVCKDPLCDTPYIIPKKINM